jgi:divalent metal cation (Fe/Co/Zn/Cd) transporter
VRFALAAYITVESVHALMGARPAEHSTVGIALAAVSLVVVPFLSYAPRRDDAMTAGDARCARFEVAISRLATRAARISR